MGAKYVLSSFEKKYFIIVFMYFCVCGSWEKGNFSLFFLGGMRIGNTSNADIIKKCEWKRTNLEARDAHNNNNEKTHTYTYKEQI